MSFLREIEIEDLMRMETRAVESPEGVPFTITMQKVHWRSAEHMEKKHRFKLSRQIQYARSWMDVYDIDLDLALAFHVNMYHRHYRNVLGAKSGPLPGACPIAYKTFQPD